VSLSVVGCAALDSAEVERLLTVELSTHAAPWDAAGDDAHVALRCEQLRVSVAARPSATAPIVPSSPSMHSRRSMVDLR